MRTAEPGLRAGSPTAKWMCRPSPGRLSVLSLIASHQWHLISRTSTSSERATAAPSGASGVLHCRLRERISCVKSARHMTGIGGYIHVDCGIHIHIVDVSSPLGWMLSISRTSYWFYGVTKTLSFLSIAVISPHTN